MSESEKERRKKKKHKKKEASVEEMIRQAQEQADQARRDARRAVADARKYTHGPETDAVPQQNPGVVHGAQDKHVAGAQFKQMNIARLGNTYINVENSQNVQIGTGNTMFVYVNKNKKGPSQDTTTDSEEDPEESVVDPKLSEKLITVQGSLRAAEAVDLIHASKNVGRKWRTFLRNLGLHDVELEHMYDNYHSRGIQEVIYQSLLLWQQKQAQTATIGALASALTTCDYKEAAAELSP